MTEYEIVKRYPDDMLQTAVNWISPDEIRIIEVGCGNGNFAEFIEQRGISRYIGVDISKNEIDKAKDLYPQYRFLVADITKNYNFLNKASMIVSFQTLQHIKDDLPLLNNIKPKTKILISVPNSPYGDAIRFFELDGWEERFSQYIDFNKIITFQNMRKPDKRSFLFKGLRNDFIDKETIKEFKNVTFDNMMYNRNL